MQGLPSVSGNGNTGTNNNTAGATNDPADIVDLFAKEDKVNLKEDKPADKPEDKPKKQPEIDEDDKEDDKDEEDSDEVKLKDIDEEEIDEEEKLNLDKEEEIKIETPPKKKELLAKYPKILEDFPWFEKMMFRDKQFTELFGSFNDAKDVKERADILDTFEVDLSKGDTVNVLKQVKENAPDAFDKVVDNYLPNLYKVDQEAYYHVVGNVIKHTIKEMWQSGTDEFKQAAKNLNKFMFNSDQYTEPTVRAKEKPKDEESSNLEKERQEFINERFQTARTDLQSRVDNVLRATITDYIDPKEEMSGYVKKNAIRDALTAVHEQVTNDPAFARTLNKLWENAFRDKFSQNSLNSIRSAYLGKAKTLLSSTIKKARSEALKGAAPVVKKQQKDTDEDTKTPRGGPIQEGAPRQRSGNNSERQDRNKLQRGESVYDFLSRD